MAAFISSVTSPCPPSLAGDRPRRDRAPRLVPARHLEPDGRARRYLRVHLIHFRYDVSAAMGGKSSRVEAGLGRLFSPCESHKIFANPGPIFFGFNKCQFALFGLSESEECPKLSEIQKFGLEHSRESCGEGASRWAANTHIWHDPRCCDERLSLRGGLESRPGSVPHTGRGGLLPRDPRHRPV